MEDKSILCKDCGCEFVFPVREQYFYRQKGLMNDPQRCKQCRITRRSLRPDAEERYVERFGVTCAECGLATTVPFRPHQHRPVYCQTCYRSHASVALS